jgi:gliding motility-associated lipoprotein GldH
MRRFFPLLVFIIIIFSSCDSRKIYEKYYDIERITWNRFDIKTFEVDIKDTPAKYDFYLALRHHTEIPFREITANITIYTPSGETRSMNCKIMLKDKDGKLLGDGMGDLWDILYPARKGLEITQPGTCKVEISSTMSQADLPGIMQVGLVVRRER